MYPLHRGGDNGQKDRLSHQRGRNLIYGVARVQP